MTRLEELKAIRDKAWDALVSAAAVKQEAEEKQMVASKTFNDSFDAYVEELDNPTQEPEMTELEELKAQSRIVEGELFEVITEVAGLSIVIQELGYNRTYNFTDAYSIDEAYECIIEGDATADKYGDVNQ